MKLSFSVTECQHVDVELHDTGQISPKPPAETFSPLSVCHLFFKTNTRFTVSLNQTTSTKHVQRKISRRVCSGTDTELYQSFILEKSEKEKILN